MTLENSDLNGMSFPSHSPESLGIYVENEAERFSQPEMVSDSKETVMFTLNRVSTNHVRTTSKESLLMCSMHKNSTDSNQTKS